MPWAAGPGTWAQSERLPFVTSVSRHFFERFRTVREGELGPVAVEGEQSSLLDTYGAVERVGLRNESSILTG